MKRLLAIAGGAIVLGACGQAGPPIAAPSASPSPSVSPTPVSEPLDFTNSTAVIFFRDPADFDQIDGMTWDGAVGKAPGVPDYHTANPAATLFGDTTAIRDRQNAVVAYGTFGVKGFAATWADDGVHYALIQPFDFLGANGAPATVKVGSVEGTRTQSVIQVGKVYEQGTIYVAAYGFEADRVVVVQSGGQGIGVAEYWVVQVSTGKVLWSHSFAAAPAPMSLVTSHDARYIAENYDAGAGVQKSSVYDGSGAKLKQYDAGVAAFSWDATTVVLTGRSGGEPPAVSTFDGRIMWSAPTKPGQYAWSAKAEPQGGRVAVAIGDPRTSLATSNWKGLPIVDLYVIGPDGRVVKSLMGVYW